MLKLPLFNYQTSKEISNFVIHLKNDYKEKWQDLTY